MFERLQEDVILRGKEEAPCQSRFRCRVLCTHNFRLQKNNLMNYIWWHLIIMYWILNIYKDCRAVFYVKYDSEIYVVEWFDKSKIFYLFFHFYHFLYELCILEEGHVSNLFSGGHSWFTQKNSERFDEFRISKIFDHQKIMDKCSFFTFWPGKILGNFCIRP